MTSSESPVSVPLDEPNGSVRFQLRLRADDQAVATTCRAFRDFLAPHDVSERARYGAELAVEELVTNVVKYAYVGTAMPPDQQIFEFQAELGNGALRLSFSDRGRPFDPTTYEPGASASNLEEAQIGGLGLLMVKQSVERWSYEHRGGNRTEVLVGA